ncbi:MAG TPA: hypothetical protein VFV03_09445 [Solirubrobacteraceae bacterium]|nr:hypothetical protein [Solirubrobacteraceae bacterium]
MSKIRIICLALFAVFAFGAFAATAAFAEEHEWLLNGNPLPTGTRDLVEAEAPSIEVEDKKGGLFGEAVKVLCSGRYEGLVGPGKEDEITEITNLAGTARDITDCVNDGNCPSPILDEPLNLPWLTELTLNGSALRDLILEHENRGAPGWMATCFGFSDTCTEKEISMLVENNAAEKDVVATFDLTSEEEPANCTRGGTGSFFVRGTVLILAPEGTLEVN